MELCIKIQDPRIIVTNLLFIRVLYAICHLWRMDAVDLTVICTSSRVLSVRAWLFSIYYKNP